MTDLSGSLSQWIPTVQGQYINVDWNPTNRGFGAQCWDLAAHWSLFLGLPVINTGGKGRWPGWAGNMVDAFPQTPEIAAAYELVSPDQSGLPGDIAVWGDSYWYYPKTHVAPLIRDLGAQLLCMSQNSTPAQAGNPYPGDSTGPTTIQHLPRQGLIGFIRPRMGIAPQSSADITPITEEEDMGHVDTISDEAAAKIAQHMLNADYQTAEGKPGKPLWVLQSLKAILTEQQQETADAVWGKHLTDDAGNLILPRWIIQSFHSIMADQRKLTAELAARLVAETVASGVTLDAEAAYKLISDKLDKALAGLSATITLGAKDQDNG